MYDMTLPTLRNETKNWLHNAETSHVYQNIKSQYVIYTFKGLQIMFW
jgi:hypothetical protein